MERTSVILSTFNRENFLVEALESILNQSFPPAEILVMDDGSTDNTEERMKVYGDRIRYIKKTNSGKADTLNQALKLVQYPLIWIMDDDDIALPNTLENLTRLLDGKPNIGIAYGCYQRFHIDEKTGDRVLRDCGYWSDTNSSNFLQHTMEDFFVHHPGLLVRKSAYDAAGPFSMLYSRMEDYEMLMRLAQVTDIANTKDIAFLQRQHDGERVNGLAAEKRFERWIFEEKLCFEALYTSLPLSVYVSPLKPNEALTPMQEREALINRSVVMARKKLWPLALNDLTSACAVDVPNSPSLTNTEKETLRRILFSKYGCPEFLEDASILEAIKTIGRKNKLGKEIAGVIARGQVWFIRKALQSLDFSKSIRHLGIMVALKFVQ